MGQESRRFRDGRAFELSNYVESYLNAQQAIIDRLKQSAPSLQGAVFPVQNEESLKVNAPSEIAAFVYYGGSTVADEIPNAAHVFMQQQWIVGIRVKNASDLRGSEAKNAIAGEAIDEVLAALLAFKPGDLNAPLRLAAIPAAFYNGSFGYYTIEFTSRIKR